MRSMNQEFVQREPIQASVQPVPETRLQRRRVRINIFDALETTFDAFTEHLNLI